MTRDLSLAKQRMIRRRLGLRDLPRGTAPAPQPAIAAVGEPDTGAREAASEGEAPYIGKRDSARRNADLIDAREPTQ